jgi:hypothetical protein
MPEAYLLVAIAQIAVALAGFSGLIAAIRTAAPEGWHARDIWSLSWMLGASIGALMLALLPLWLTLFKWSYDLTYRTSSVAAFLYIAMFLCIMLLTGRRLTRSGHPPRVRYFTSVVVLLLGVSTVSVGAGAAGWLHGSVAPAYVGSLITLLVVSAMVLAVYLVLLSRLARVGRDGA